MPGPVHIYGSTTTFFGNFTNTGSGSVKVSSGTVYFLGNTSVSGLYTSDPSTNYFNGLPINSAAPSPAERAISFSSRRHPVDQCWDFQ